MQEITRVFLENEMDVILAHKHSMRLAELAGLSLAGQTTFATAVSEVSRNAVEQGNEGQLLLGVATGQRDTEKFIVALVREKDPEENERRAEGYRYAQKLVNAISHTLNDTESNIELRFRIPNGHKISLADLRRWTEKFESDLPSSPYDEIKRKNRQLVALTEKLRASELQYRNLTESLPILIFTWSEEQGTTFINKWTQDFTGATTEHLNDTRWQAVYHPDDYGQVRAAWLQARDEGRMLHTQIRLRQAATGEYLWHLYIIMPQKNETGGISFWIGFCVDIHAQKLVEQTLKDNKELIATQAELQQKIRQLNQSNEELERFAYVASHDLQEPLRKIVFYSDYLKKRYASLYDEQGALFFNNMMSATQRMQQLIRDVLAYSTIRQEQPEHELVDLNQVVAEVVQDLDLKITDKRARLRVSSLPLVKGNAYQLRQLFANLLSNALKYTSGKQQPEIGVTAEAAPAGRARISVSDNGIGFEDQYLDKMFNLFQRLHGHDQFEGTGIGLAICKRVAELHGGSITGRGIPGEGAVFTVTLPVAAVEEPAL